MKDFFTLNWQFTRFNVAKFINGLFYYLRKIPLIGKFIPVEIFKGYTLKKVLGIILSVCSLVYPFAMKSVWFFGYIFFANFIRMNNPNVSGAFLWLVLVGFFFSFINCYFYVISQSQLNFVKYFQISGTRFYRKKMLYEMFFRDSIAYVPVFIFAVAVIHLNIWMCINLWLTYNMFTLLGLYGDRLVFKHHISRFLKNTLGWLLVGVLSTSAFFIAIYGKIDLFMQVFTNPIFSIIFLAISVLCLWNILHFKKENDYILAVTNKSSAAFEKAATTSSSQYMAEGIALQKTLKVTDSSGIGNLHGSNYLNALLFNRYNDGLRKALFLRLGITTGVGVVLTLILKFANVSGSESQLYSALPVLIFLVYLANLGKKIVQMCFVNCDSAMLHYPFYREAKNIRDGLTFRFLRSFIFNFPIVANMFLMILLVTLVNGIPASLGFYLTAGLLLLSLSLFFSFHELFVYYLLQPFSEDMSVKNPLYGIINFAVYFFAYMSLQVKTTSVQYLILVSIVSILYVSIGYFIIYRKAPQTFRLK